MGIVLPLESDYPEEVFRTDLPPELLQGCAWYYFKSNWFVRKLFRRRTEMAFSLIPQRDWGRMLDAGTGAGYLLPGLSSMACEVVGTDL